MNVRVKVLLVIAVAAFWAACKKDNNDAPAPVVSTSINVVNVSSNTINFFLNGTRQNTGSSFYPGGSLGYLVVPAGTNIYSFRLIGSPTDIFSLSLPLADSSNYSLYVAGEKAEDAFYTHDVLSLDSGYARVRFVNASPDAGALNLAFEGSKGTVILDTIKSKALAYKSTSSFFRVKVGVHNLSVYQTSQPLNPLRDTITVSANRIYTYYSYGSAATAGNQGLSTGLIANY